MIIIRRPAPRCANPFSAFFPAHWGNENEEMQIVGKEKEDDDLYCGQCDKILGNVQADLKAEVGVA